MLYYIFYVGINAAIRKREGAYVNLVGLFIMVLVIINDTLYYLRLLNTIEMLDYGVFMFILLQAIIISYRYSLLFKKNHGLTVELVKMNATLEEKVVDRTRELNHKNEELVEMHQTRTKMLANIAHDLGSPIVGIQTNLQLMQKGRIQAGEPTVMRQLLDKAAYMHRLNSDLFELSKLESKKLSFQFERVGAQEFIQEVYRRFEPDLKNANGLLQLGRLETVVNGEEGFIMMDKIRMIQVLQNFIENAVKFSGESDKSVLLNAYVSLPDSGEVSSREFYVELVDQGKGISPEDLPFVFDRFYKKREGNERGSGLGLAISKEIIEQHQGRIGVKGKLGLGSTFYFILPLL